MNQLASWVDAVLGYVYPNTCQVCHQGRAGTEEGFVCRECWQQVRFVKPPYCRRCGLPFEGDISEEFECTNCRDLKLHFEFARAAVHARGMVLALIHRYKYHGEVWFERFLADLLVRSGADLPTRDGWDLIIPVPLHPLKERERGFNQARNLAHHLAVATGIPMAPQTLKRIRPTATQTQLTRKERAVNVHKAFTAPGKVDLTGRRCVLIDDVLTTGATTNACAKVLKDAGAAAVCVWTLARGI